MGILFSDKSSIFAYKLSYVILYEYLLSERREKSVEYCEAALKGEQCSL